MFMCSDAIRSNMGKINGEKYPDLSPDEAENIADTLVNEFGGDVSSEEAFAQSIGHSTANSGAYRGKIADMRRYGLLPTRGLEATDLALRLANPQAPAEEYKAKYEMLDNVSILSDLYDHLEGMEPPAEFWRIISEVTDANPKDAREAADDLLDLYEAMIRFEERGGRATSKPAETKTVPTESSIRERQTEDTVSDDSAILVRVNNDVMRFQEVTEGNVNLAKMFLENQLKKGETDNNAEKDSGDDDQATLVED